MRQLIHACSRIVIVIVAISLILPVNGVYAASEVATKMKHSPPDTYIPGFRIVLNADIKDSTGIKEARCYFRAKDAPEFVFVDMQKANGAFEALLPAPELGARAVNYFFLSLNGNNKVARSQVFELVEQDTGEAKDLRDAEQAKAKGKDIDLDSLKDRLTDKLEKEYKANIKKHQMVRSDQAVKVKTEVSEMTNKVSKFKDNVTTQQVSADARYGLMKSEVATVTATSSGLGVGAVVAGLAVIAGGAAVAGGGGGGGGGGSTAPAPLTTQTIVGVWNYTGTNSINGGTSSGTFNFAADGTVTLAGVTNIPGIGPVSENGSGVWTLNGTTLTISFPSGFSYQGPAQGDSTRFTLVSTNGNGWTINFSR